MPIDIKSKFIDSEMATDAELASGLSLKENKSEKNQPNGYAGLNATGLIPSELLPSAFENQTIDGGNPMSTYEFETIDGGAP